MKIPMKARLSMAEKTQRWMLEQLHNNGFPDLAECTLSDINRGKYKGRCSKPVLEAENQILEEVENRAKEA